MVKLCICYSIYSLNNSAVKLYGFLFQADLGEAVTSQLVAQRDAFELVEPNAHFDMNVAVINLTSHSSNIDALQNQKSPYFSIPADLVTALPKDMLGSTFAADQPFVALAKQSTKRKVGQSSQSLLKSNLGAKASATVTSAEADDQSQSIDDGDSEKKKSKTNIESAPTQPHEVQPPPKQPQTSEKEPPQSEKKDTDAVAKSVDPQPSTSGLSQPVIPPTEIMVPISDNDVMNVSDLPPDEIFAPEPSVGMVAEPSTPQNEFNLAYPDYNLDDI